MMKTLALLLVGVMLNECSAKISKDAVDKEEDARTWFGGAAGVQHHMNNQMANVHGSAMAFLGAYHGDSKKASGKHSSVS